MTEHEKRLHLLRHGWQTMPDKSLIKWDLYGLFIGPTTEAAWQLQEKLEPIQ